MGGGVERVGEAGRHWSPVGDGCVMGGIEASADWWQMEGSTCHLEAPGQSSEGQRRGCQMKEVTSRTLRKIGVWIALIDAVLLSNRVTGLIGGITMDLRGACSAAQNSQAVATW